MPKTLHEIIRDALIEALDACDWVQYRAAARLGISHRVLAYKMAKFGIPTAQTKGKRAEVMRDPARRGDLDGLADS